jgi:hypothetical protein
MFYPSPHVKVWDVIERDVRILRQNRLLDRATYSRDITDGKCS